MTDVFADTNYFITLIHANDQWHERAVAAESLLKSSRVVTTDSVLIELLNFVSGYGPQLRRAVASFVRESLADPAMEVLPQTRGTLLEGLKLYEARADKGYSLTDCISMRVASELGITKVLTHDHHFEQEGFDLLLL